MVLLPVWLIDQRYYFIPFTLFLLFICENEKIIDYITLIYYMFTSVFIFFRGCIRNIFSLIVSHFKKFLKVHMRYANSSYSNFLTTINMRRSVSFIFSL